jgi:hypothetical protein
MPFKTIAAPRKLSSVDAELRAACFLNTPGMVAMLGHTPVRIATFAFGGAPGKVTNVSLDGADAVALLNRDIAVVRGSDDSVWALLDITHTPKMDQVGRDVRALAFRPGGETALALGWDGSASELRVSRNEVEARQFSLRGALRAIDVGETECYALVDGADGADGGQLRVHPGATPEPGASLRVNLPAAAASLDQVRGGPRLAAVWKPGKRTVCLATGGPARLVAKLVELEDAPSALGVLDTSLVVAFSDGKVSLYDSDAIAAAGEGAPITPKHTTSLGTRGKPEALVLTQKGGATLWIGTSTGEVLSASLVKKAPPV